MTVGIVEVTADPPIVALIVVAVPEVVPVNVAVYVPFELSVTEPNVPLEVPPDRVNATVRPPLVSWLPAASFAVRVTVTPDPEATVPEETETID